MPIFIILVFLAAAVLWALLSFVFIPLGRFVASILNDAKDAIDQEDPVTGSTADNTNQE